MNFWDSDHHCEGGQEKDPGKMKTHLQSLESLGEGVDPDDPDGGVGPFSLLDFHATL